jgi:small-conductance mechanosensitive channel
MTTPVDETAPEAPAQVDVEPTAQDAEIDERLTSILIATEWFIEPEVVVRDGVVFLDGRTLSQERREWAGNLARNTQDVVAVVNRVQVIPRSVWDFSPAWVEVQSLWRAAIQAIPGLFFGILILLLSWWLAGFVSRIMRRLLQDRLASPLLTSVAARVIAIPVFVLGLYLVLQVAGLTRLALTLLGGTGIVGIVVGFAFRDIAENFLASILLSMQQPFRREDVIKVAEHMGIVQQMNTRSTVLMTLEGNHVQIPNAVIFKSTIINYTANPNRRSEFKVGIGYDSSISQAQEIIAGVLTAHPAVLTSPEPLVLVDELGTSAVNLCIQFWSDATQFSPPKVKSSLIRLTKRALEDAYISMPDEAREVIFPKGVPLLQMPPQETEAAKQVHKHSVGQPSAGPTRTEPLITAAEGDLNSEDQEIRAQAERARVPEQGEDLLEGD